MTVSIQHGALTESTAATAEQGSVGTSAAIVPLQCELERAGAAPVSRCDAEGRDRSPDEAVDEVTRSHTDGAGSVPAAWHALSDRLTAKCSHGYLNSGDGVAPGRRDIGYPADWLTLMDCGDGPTGHAMQLSRSGARRGADA